MNLQEKFKNYLEVQTNYAIPTIEKWSKDLTQIAEESKELIAEGEVIIEEDYITPFVKIGDKYIGEFSEKIEKYQGKKVKLILETQEELPKFKDIIGLFKEEER